MSELSLLEGDKLRELVENFSSANKNKEYIYAQNEEWVKWNYLEPLLEILGWKRGDIVKEQRILKGRADYILKISNEEVAVIEAKKVGVSLSEDEGRQAVSYAYHRKIKFAILTNFKEIRVYHALTNIKNIDHNLIKLEHGGYFRFNFEQFVENIDKLMLLSRESFESKRISKLLPSKIEKASKPIDESILEDLLQFRDWLSKDLKKTRMSLTKEQIDEIVQMFIDRLIFMRSVEDRGLESANFLLGLVDDVRLGRTDKTLWSSLKEQFKIFDKSYNSKLFAEGLLEKEGFFDEQTLVKVIRGLYFGTKDQQARYMFDEIPGDLLGNIYEQYLGTILQDTEKRVKLDETSGKRKKMGIYYTPSYIVDYIVRNTVGEYVKNKSIDEILEVKIVDPACGSGSFIVRAFQEVCNAIEERLKKGEKGKMVTFQKYQERLSFGQKISILTQCIYGVDLDEKAVELAQLNLLLKLLEDESPESHKRLLPNLRENIKCGNSLIDDSSISDRSFKWEAQFKEVFNDGGFDIVIGNPPYIRVELLNHREADYLKTRYKTVYQRCDIYIAFIEKGYNLLKKKGVLGFINPNQFVVAEYGVKIKEFLVKNRFVKEIVDFGDNQVFEGISTYTMIFIGEKSSNDTFKYKQIKDKKSYESLKENSDFFIIAYKTIKKSDEWNFKSNILSKILEESSRLAEVSSIKSPLTTGADSLLYLKIVNENQNFYEISKDGNNFSVEKEVWKKIIRPEQIRPWLTKDPELLVFFPYTEKDNKYHLIEESTFKNNYPQTYKILSGSKRELENRMDSRKTWKELGREWYSLHRVGKPEDFISNKVLINSIINKKTFSLDADNNLYPHGGIFGIIPNKIELKFLLGVLNSSLVLFVLKQIGSPKRGGYISLNINILEKIPIKQATKIQERDIIKLADQMLSLQKRFHDSKLSGGERERLEQQIKNIDYEIDQEVYKLYGITKEEQKIIEESLT